MFSFGCDHFGPSLSSRFGFGGHGPLQLDRKPHVLSVVLDPSITGQIMKEKKEDPTIIIIIMRPSKKDDDKKKMVAIKREKT